MVAWYSKCTFSACIDHDFNKRKLFFLELQSPKVTITFDTFLGSLFLQMQKLYVSL